MTGDATERQFAIELATMFRRLAETPDLENVNAAKARLRESHDRITTIRERKPGGHDQVRRDAIEMAAEYFVVAKVMRMHGDKIEVVWD